MATTNLQATWDDRLGLRSSGGTRWRVPVQERRRDSSPKGLLASSAKDSFIFSMVSILGSYGQAREDGFFKKEQVGTLDRYIGGRIH